MVHSLGFALASGDGATESHGRGHIEDPEKLAEQTMDRGLDMVLHFKAAETGIDENTTDAWVKFIYIGGEGNLHRLVGCYAVLIPPGGAA